MIPLGRKILLFFSLFVAILGSVLACHGETLSQLFEKARITLPQRPLEAHSFVLPDVNGNQLSLEDLRGKIVFLNIWAIWCAPCREEMPSIEKLHQRFQGRDFTILAVSVDMADTEFVKAFVDHHKYTFTILHDPRGDIMKWFRVRLIPVTYLIDKSGMIIGKAIGFRDWSQESMVRLFEELLKKSEK